MLRQCWWMDSFSGKAEFLPTQILKQRCAEVWSVPEPLSGILGSRKSCLKLVAGQP